jgi:hypothetical protein
VYQPHVLKKSQLLGGQEWQNQGSFRALLRRQANQNIHTTILALIFRILSMEKRIMYTEESFVVGAYCPLVPPAPGVELA